MKTLIAYYSRKGGNYVSGDIVDLPVGNTEVIARKIHALLPDAEMFHIDTVGEYPKDYTQTTEVAKQELRAQARPELKTDVSPDEFDTIILGYPNWWGTMPMAVFTWLEAHNFSGKRIIPFCTHEGSGMGHSENDIKRTCHGAEVLRGTSIHGSGVAQADSQARQIADSANS